MYSTNSHNGPQCSGAALPVHIPRAGVHLQVHQPLNIVDPGVVSSIRAFSRLELTSCLGPHYQILSPSEPYMYTPTSSRTGSSASLHPGTPSVAYLQPLSRSASHSPKKMPSRPALKSNNTWTTSSVGSTCTPIFISSRKPDLSALQIPHLTHDPTLRSTSQPASTCILSLPIHAFIMHQSSTTWAGPRQLGLFWIALRILRSRRIPLPSLLQIHLPRHPINSFSGLTNSHGRSSSKPVRLPPRTRRSSALTLVLPSRGLSLLIWTCCMRSTLRSSLASPLRSGKPWATEARRNGRLRVRTRSVARLWEAGKVVSVVWTGWAERPTWLVSKWTGAAETVSANWSLPESAERSLRFGCYTPPHEKYIHIFAVCACLLFFFTVLGYPAASYHAFLRWLHAYFGLLSLVWVCNPFVCTHISPSVHLVHSCNVWS